MAECASVFDEQHPLGPIYPGPRGGRNPQMKANGVSQSSIIRDWEASQLSKQPINVNGVAKEKVQLLPKWVSTRWKS